MKRLLYLLAVSVIILSCSKNDSNNNNIEAANIARMQEFYDQVMNAHNPSMIDSFVTSDFIDHQADPRHPAGIEGLKATMMEFFTAFPDLNFKTNIIKAWGDTVMAQVTITGTNSGPFMGMPATNKQINYDGVDIVILKDRKAVEHWGYQEDMKMMAQLGLGQGPPVDSMVKK